MSAILPVHYEAAYDLAKRIRASEMSEAQAADILASEHGMDRGSAYGYVRQLEKFLSGTVYTRTINDAATRHYLTHIADDFGSAALERSLDALGAHIAYYEAKASARPSLRTIHAEFVAKFNQLATTDAALEAAVARARAMPADERAKLLPPSGHKPVSVERMVKAFSRSPYVIATVLERAQGVCEFCGEPAPFKRKTTGLPFLEVHHKHRLADGGEDTLANAEALCPNCHRERHFG